jgi:hypothetical protein
MLFDIPIVDSTTSISSLYCLIVISRATLNVGWFSRFSNLKIGREVIYSRWWVRGILASPIDRLIPIFDLCLHMFCCYSNRCEAISVFLLRYDGHANLAADRRRH